MIVYYDRALKVNMIDEECESQRAPCESIKRFPERK